MILLFIGPSGSGKDTQAEFLVDEHGYDRVSTGDLIREVAKGEHKIHRQINRHMNEGFMDDMFVFGLLQMYLSDLSADKFILSGVVRKETQVDLLDKTLNSVGRKLDKVIYFDLNDEEAIIRMSGRSYCGNCHANYHEKYFRPRREDVCNKCGSELKKRLDDNPESVKKRLRDFHMSNKQIVQRYEERGILIKINAANSIEEVKKEIYSKLNLNQ